MGDIHNFKRWLSMLRRAAEANPVAGDLLSYIGNNQAQWIDPAAVAVVPDHDHTGDAGDGAQLDHGAALTAASLADDDHSGHPWLLGRSGGQTLYGGTDASDDLTLRSTFNATKGYVILADSAAEWVGIGTAAPTERLHVRGATGTDSYIFVEDTAVNSYAGIKIKNDARQWNIQVNSSDQLEFRDVTSATNFMTASPGLPANTIYADSSGHVGITCVPATSSALEITSTTGALVVPRMTTTQRNALTAVNGMIIYNTTTNAFNFYEAGAWVTGSGLT